MDGQDWFEEYTEGHRKAGLAFVEITEDEWNAYLTFGVQSRLWTKFIRDKANEQWYNEHPDDPMAKIFGD